MVGRLTIASTPGMMPAPLCALGAAKFPDCGRLRGGGDRGAGEAQPAPEPILKLNTLTTVEIAGLLGVTPQRVAAIARSRGIEPVRVVGRAYLWDAGDLPRFERRPQGRPRAEPGGD